MLLLENKRIKYYVFVIIPLMFSSVVQYDKVLHYLK